jgi:hypothetical protein
MLHILLFLVLNISPATQSEKLFVVSDSLMDNYVYGIYYQFIHHLKPYP